MLVLVCPYWYKKMREIEKTGNGKTVITRTLAGLRTSTRCQKLPFLMLFQMVFGALGIFSHLFSSKNNFMIFPQFSAFSGFSLHGNPILSSDLVSTSNFISITVVRIFF